MREEVALRRGSEVDDCIVFRDEEVEIRGSELDDCLLMDGELWTEEVLLDLKLEFC